MQRRRRHHLPEEVYRSNSHAVSVTVCTANRGRWMADEPLAAVVRNEIFALDHVIGFCIMPDHAHLLFVTAGELLGTAVGRFKGRVSRQARLSKPGLAVWQQGYWDHVVRRTEGILPTLKYILLNPVRAGLVEDWWRYRWSGAPLLGEIGPNLFNRAEPEDVIWCQLLGGGP
jgi:putative transposase